MINASFDWVRILFFFFSRLLNGEGATIRWQLAESARVHLFRAHPVLYPPSRADGIYDT